MTDVEMSDSPDSDAVPDDRGDVEISEMSPAPIDGVAHPPTGGAVTQPAASEAASQIDLDAVARDLADVETALARLDAGTYWTDEISGEPLSDELLAEQPTARRAAGA